MMEMNLQQGLFLAGVLVLALAAACAVLLPALRRIRRSHEQDRDGLNVAIYQQRLQESDADADEAGTRLVEDTAATQAKAENNKPLSWLATVLLVLAVPAIALSLYLSNDGWRLIGASAAQPPVDYIVQQMQARTQAQAENPEAWLALARTYRNLQRYTDAAAAYAHANALKPANATALAEQGELLANLADGDMSGRPLALFHQALVVDPKQTKALFYLGLWSYLQKDKANALQFWQTLALQPLPSALVKVLRKKVEQLGGQWPGPGQGSLRLNLQISLDPALRAQLPAEGVLFVYAKHPQGPPRPVAAVRIENLQFPQRVALSDADAVMGQKLSASQRWLVTARISAAGQAMAQSGDLYGEKLVTLPMARAGQIKIRIHLSIP